MPAGGGELFAVVEDQQNVLGPEPLHQGVQRLRAQRLRRLDGPGYGAWQLSGICHGRQVDPPDAVREPRAVSGTHLEEGTRDLERQPGLPASADSDEREHPVRRRLVTAHLAAHQQPCQVDDLRLTADEAREVVGKVIATVQTRGHETSPRLGDLAGQSSTLADLLSVDEVLGPQASP
jgi:hypothetical protein